MPVCKAEAHRALELLEDYYSRLDDSDEKELKAAIERVIKIFKSRLFQVRKTKKVEIRFQHLWPIILISLKFRNNLFLGGIRAVFSS